jgi:hypothetical protein
MDFTLRSRPWIEIDPELGQGRGRKHCDEPSDKLDQRLHRRSPLFERLAVYALKTAFEQSRSA